MEETVSIHDLARELQMSASTVSRALNGQAGVSAKRAAEIKNFAKAIGYQPTPYHRKKSSCLALFLPDTAQSDEQFTRRLICLAEKYAVSLGKYIFVCFGDINSDKLPPLLTNRRVDGVILAQYPPRAWINEIRNNGLPLIAINDLSTRLGCDCVIGNPLHGTSQLARRLLQNGHQKFSFVVTDRNYPTVERRFKAFEMVLEENNISIDRQMVIEHVPVSMKGGINAVRKLFSSNRKHPDAVIFTNDWCAIGGMYGLAQLGIKVPNDISVAAFDNTSVCEELDPELTSVDLRIDKVVKIAIDHLINVIENHDGKDYDNYSQTEVDSELVWRKSCR